jgi:hypothetical protein
LLGYAEFLGIKLPQEEDLMWIAEEGICAELPDGWETEESPEDGEIVYINTNTGERSFVHPCDDYYKQLVVQERRKKGGMKGMMQQSKNQPGGGAQLNYNKLMQQQQIMPQAQPKPVVVDPLVKMQQEKALRKLEEAKKKEFEDKKKALKDRHEAKKEELAKELRDKEERANEKYRSEITAEKTKQIKKMG